MLNPIIACVPPQYLLGGFLREAPAQYKKSSGGDVERAVMYVWVWHTSGTRGRKNVHHTMLFCGKLEGKEGTLGGKTSLWSRLFGFRGHGGTNPKQQPLTYSINWISTPPSQHHLTLEE